MVIAGKILDPNWQVPSWMSWAVRATKEIDLESSSRVQWLIKVWFSPWECRVYITNRYQQISPVATREARGGQVATEAPLTFDIGVWQTYQKQDNMMIILLRLGYPTQIRSPLIYLVEIGPDNRKSPASGTWLKSPMRSVPMRWISKNGHAFTKCQLQRSMF